MVKKLKKAHTYFKKKKYPKALEIYQEFLDEYPEAEFINKYRLKSYFEMEKYTKAIESGIDLLENGIDPYFWEDIFWTVIAAYFRLGDIESAKKFYYLFKEQLPYFTVSFDIEKLHFLMKLNPEQSERYETAIHFSNFLATFHKVTNNRLKHLINTQYQYLWYKFREKVNIPPTVNLFDWLDDYYEDIKKIKDLDLNQARWLSNLSNKEIIDIIKEIRPSFNKSLSKKEYEELERIRCTFYHKVVKSNKEKDTEKV